jgi:hypothetical protein
VRADEWADELAETLAHGHGGLATMTLAECANSAAVEDVITVARKNAEAAGWDLYEIDARSSEGNPSLLPAAGYIILHDIRPPAAGRSPGGADWCLPASGPERPPGRDGRGRVPGRNPGASAPSGPGVP